MAGGGLMLSDCLSVRPFVRSSVYSQTSERDVLNTT